MDRWTGKVCVVTGAAGSIGSITVKTLLNYGLIVVGLDKSEDKLQELKAEVSDNHFGQFHTIHYDARNEQSIINAFQLVENCTGAPVSILINCAGVVFRSELLHINEELLDATFQINVTSTAICMKEAVNSMLKNNIDGHVINICSVLGHEFVNWNTEGAVYSASKNAVRVLSEGLRRELVLRKSKIKITNLSPGFVKSAMTETLKTFVKMDAINVAEACVTILKADRNALVSQLTIESTIERVESADVQQFQSE